MKSVCQRLRRQNEVQISNIGRTAIVFNLVQCCSSSLITMTVIHDCITCIVSTIVYVHVLRGSCMDAIIAIQKIEDVFLNRL